MTEIITLHYMCVKNIFLRHTNHIMLSAMVLPHILGEWLNCQTVFC